MRLPEPVSVVITCHNLERYIGDAIESVIGQDYNGSIEIIVVDDCSADRSLDVIRRFSGVEVLSLPQNCGVLNATLTGISRASHDIVMLLDGDDTWDRTKVKETTDAFQKETTIAFVTHDLRYVDSDARSINRTSKVGIRFRNVQDDTCSDILIEGILYHHDYVWLGSALSFRKSRSDFDGYAKFCATLPDPKNTYQDWPLAFWIASMCNTRLAIVRRPLFSYRVHGKNYSGDSTTVSKAVRNALRSLNTSLAMQTIATDRGLDKSIRKRMDSLVQYYRFMFMCYSGLGAQAIVPFVMSIPFILRERNFPKELFRLLSFNVLSPDRAMRILNVAR